MNDIPTPQGDVLRRNPEHECGRPVGQLNVAVHGLPGFQTVSFYCNLPRLHRDECAFRGREVSVTKNRRALIVNSKP